LLSPKQSNVCVGSYLPLNVAFWQIFWQIQSYKIFTDWAFYRLAWQLGAAQTDLAMLTAEDVDWEQKVISFFRRKTKSVARLHFGAGVAAILQDLPGQGPPFPYLSTVRAGDRATEFKQRCQQLGITGVTLHSYRYAWAERAKTAGMPERFAMESLHRPSPLTHRIFAWSHAPMNRAAGNLRVNFPRC
jgi:integrase